MYPAQNCRVATPHPHVHPNPCFLGPFHQLNLNFVATFIQAFYFRTNTTEPLQKPITEMLN